MQLEKTHVIVEFIFKGIEPPYMVLGQESCMTLSILEGRVVKKLGNPAMIQYLKV